MEKIGIHSFFLLLVSFLIQFLHYAPRSFTAFSSYLKSLRFHLLVETKSSYSSGGYSSNEFYSSNRNISHIHISNCPVYLLFQELAIDSIRHFKTTTLLCYSSLVFTCYSYQQLCFEFVLPKARRYKCSEIGYPYF